MLHKSSTPGLLGLIVGLLASALAWAATTRPAFPDEAKGFVGTLEGTVTGKAPANGWIALTVTKVNADSSSKVKDGSVLVNKELPVSCRLTGDTPFPEQTAYVAALKLGDKIAIEVFYRESSHGGALRIKEVPGAATTKALSEN